MFRDHSPKGEMGDSEAMKGLSTLPRAIYITVEEAEAEVGW